MGDLGDKILLGLVESDLAAPEMMDDVDADQKEGKKEEPFDENEPVRPGREDDRAVLLRKFAEAPLVADKPDDPGGHQPDPENLDGNDHHQRRIKGAKEALHSTFYHCRPRSGKQEVLQNYYIKKKNPVVISWSISQNPL